MAFVFGLFLNLLPNPSSPNGCILDPEDIGSSVSISEQSEYETWADVISANTPIFVYLYMENCSSCHRFDSSYENLKTRYEDEMIFTAFNLQNTNRLFIRNFKCNSVPKVYLINPNTSKILYVPNTGNYNVDGLSKVIDEFIYSY